MAAVEQGLTPLDYLTSVYLDESIDIRCRLEAAKAAAPYVHPRLSQIEVQATAELRYLSDEQLEAELVALLIDPEVQRILGPRQTAAVSVASGP
jgi:hypothetical protein